MPRSAPPASRTVVMPMRSVASRLLRRLEEAVAERRLQQPHGVDRADRHVGVAVEQAGQERPCRPGRPARRRRARFRPPRSRPSSTTRSATAGSAPVPSTRRAPANSGACHARRLPAASGVASVAVSDPSPAFVSVDIEASGPSPSRHAILSIGACLVDDPSRGFYAELQPSSREADPTAMRVHGLSLDELAAHGEEPADGASAARGLARRPSWTVGHRSSSATTPPSTGCSWPMRSIATSATIRSVTRRST